MLRLQRHFDQGDMRMWQKMLCLVLLAVPWMAVADQNDAPVSPFITVDQFGYLPVSSKVAVLRNPEEGFDAALSYTPGDELQLVDEASGEVVFSAAAEAWSDGALDPQSGDRVWWFDFSAVELPGRYYVADPANDVRSAGFAIDDNVYRSALRAAFRAFYYQRAGFAKKAPFAEAGWEDAASHIGPGQDTEARLYSARDDARTERDLSGGWYDAGDYNRYTPWHANYLVTLSHAYLENSAAWTDDFGIPESGNGIPDLIDELMWGLEWLKKMQDGAEDGGVLSILGADDGTPPSAATGPSYYGPATTHASLRSAAAFAASAIAIESLPGDALDAYARDLVERAERAWAWAKDNPEVVFYNRQGEARDIAYGEQETDDAGRAEGWRMAAVYLFAATGGAEYQQHVVAGYEHTPIVAWHGNVNWRNERETSSMLLYSLLPDADPAARDTIRRNYALTMERDYTGGAVRSKRAAYRAYMDSEQYTWGSNRNVAKMGQMLLNLEHYGFADVEGVDPRAAALDYLHYFHGVNPLGMVFLSNMEGAGATRSVREFYHGWFADGSELWDRVGESTYGPAPGFLVGGPTKSYKWDACCPSSCGTDDGPVRCDTESLVPPNGQPPLKAFKEFNTSWPLNSWIVTENHNSYQAPYLRLLAAFATPRSDDRNSWSYEPHPSNLAAREWFQDAKFGIFIHWGIYSVLADGEWVMHRQEIPIDKYERVADFFNPTGFDAYEWVRAFKSAGAKYVTITTKHHDGFAMYDSAVSDYDIVERTPYGKDIIAALKEACDRHGLKLFFYYSQLDWHHPDYYPRGRTGGDYTGRPDEGDWDAYIDYMNAQLRELLTNYGDIGGFWFDGWWDQKDGPMKHRWRLQETYELIHELQPQALIISNHHTVPFPGESVQPFEKDLPGANTAGFNTTHIAELPLEMAQTMNGSWGFNLQDDKFKTTKELVHTIVAAAGRNTNFLMNTGPMPNGKLQPENIATYKEIGAWLEVYGESVYGTRGGPLAPAEWGVTTQTGDAVYVHVLDAETREVVIELNERFSSASLVKNGASVEMRREEKGYRLTLPAAGANEWVRVIRLGRR